MEFLRKNKIFLRDTLSTDSTYILKLAKQNDILIDEENENPKQLNKTDKQVIIDLVDGLRDKGEETSKKFVELLKNENLQTKFPGIKNLFPSAPSGLPGPSGPSGLPVLHQDYPVQSSNEIGEYNMSKDTRFCVIINNVDFTPYNNNPINKLKMAEPIKERKGANKDSDYLKRVFSWLGFTVFKYTNQTAEQMREILKKFGQENHAGDCFVCCIMSHGCAGGVYGTDGGIVTDEDIFGPFRGLSCKSLANKPKAFFIQACRGSRIQPLIKVQDDSGGSGKKDALESDVSQLITIPDDADFFVARATVKGFISLRNEEWGTWFIQTLCCHLEKCCPQGEDILHIMIRVNQDVSRSIGELEIKPQVYVPAKQMPVQTTTLTKKLVFRVST